MKNIYLIVLFSSFNFISNAQSFVFSNEQHVEAVILEQNVPHYINFTTQTPRDITFKYERISNTLPEEWDLTLCDYNGCYVGVPETGTMTNITRQDALDGIDGFFNLAVNTNDISGEGVVEIYVYDSTDYNVGDTVSWTMSHEAIPNAIDKNEADNISIYPNPASDQIQIRGIEGYTMTIYNSLGKIIYTKVDASNTRHDITNFPSGSYFISCLTKQGKVYNKQFVVF